MLNMWDRYGSLVYEWTVSGDRNQSPVYTEHFPETACLIWDSGLNWLYKSNVEQMDFHFGRLTFYRKTSYLLWK